MMITKKAEYAIWALVELSGVPGQDYLSSAAVAARQGIPANLIAQTVAILRRRGWVRSQRGAAGGIRLEADPAAISLLEVVEAVDGPLGITRCLTGEGTCANSGSCSLQGIWSEAQARMLDVLEGISIADLARARKGVLADRQP